MNFDFFTSYLTIERTALPFDTKMCLLLPLLLEGMARDWNDEMFPMHCREKVIKIGIHFAFLFRPMFMDMKNR